MTVRPRLLGVNGQRIISTAAEGILLLNKQQKLKRHSGCKREKSKEKNGRVGEVKGKSQPRAQLKNK